MFCSQNNFLAMSLSNATCIRGCGTDCTSGCSPSSCPHTCKKIRIVYLDSKFMQKNRRNLCFFVTDKINTYLVKLRFSEKATKIWRTLPLSFDFTTISGRFLQILWPSPSIWILTIQVFLTQAMLEHVNTTLFTCKYYRWNISGTV